MREEQLGGRVRLAGRVADVADARCRSGVLPAGAASGPIMAPYVNFLVAPKNLRGE